MDLQGLVQIQGTVPFYKYCMPTSLDQITSLALEVTSHCNLKCPQCGRTSTDGRFASQYLQLRHWRTDALLPHLEIERLNNLKFVRIEGDNGDALMHPGIEEIIQHFYDAPSKPVILIFTNGSMRSTDWWRSLGKNFPDRLVMQFSIDGLSNTNHLYRVNSDYDKIIKNAQAFIEGGGLATVRSIIFKHNEHQVQEIHDTMLGLGFKQLIMIPNDVTRFWTGDRYEVYVDGIKSHDIYPTRYKQQDLNKYCYKNHGLVLRGPQRIDGKIICPGIAGSELTVTYLGHVIPCCMVHSDYDYKIPANDLWRSIVGDRSKVDLHKRSISEILSDPDLYFHRLEMSLRDSKIHQTCSSYCGNIIKRKLQ